MLLCRKSRDTVLLITPGGRIEPNESAENCIHREVTEELGPEVQAINLEYIGTYRDIAAGAADRIVEIQLWRADLVGDPRPMAEIAELIWFGPDDDETALSPSLRNKILPDLRERGIFG